MSSIFSVPAQFASLALEVIKLAIGDDMNPFALITGDRLIPGYEIDDAQPSMTQTKALIGGQPSTPSVGTAGAQAARGALKRPC